MSSAELVAVWLVRLLAAYAGIGIVFAAAMTAGGLERIDRSTVGATWGFRLIAMPGLAALWPWLVRRWWRAAGEIPVETNAHRRPATSRREP